MQEIYDVEYKKFENRSDKYKESVQGEEDESNVCFLEGAVQNLCDVSDNMFMQKKLYQS